MKEIKQVCVYCASSTQIDRLYLEATEVLAKELVKHNITVVFGGGSVGLMGKLADVVLSEGGRIIGIMPQFMRDVEWAHKQVKEFHFVGDMHERKKKFLDGTDALITLPGGCGTLEELLEAITLKRLGLFTKPIIIVNINHYYDPLIDMLEKCISENFMSEQHRQMWTVIEDTAQIIEAIQSSPAWEIGAIQTARV
ncbi:TIGR00730 family Rossman fold protein [Rhodocytophaga rosea]|uniref:Cytokinin riboside 5'-monophosphate phosphoribohydrolase n=1 Tax=Rhodocytophaga rosea TaxID=2704465 RepID=A0A6C0GJT0_9BACT|nr:TIGR00730 family Rossman fold protein [Rhodocytophaga rosea]QHT68245.1 TIGR00730 family Rossman fold protein [Rhodocytophaga rosea]